MKKREQSVAKFHALRSAADFERAVKYAGSFFPNPELQHGAIELRLKHFMSHETAKIGKVPLGRWICREDVHDFAIVHFTHTIAQQHQRFRA